MCTWEWRVEHIVKTDTTMWFQIGIKYRRYDRRFYKNTLRYQKIFTTIVAIDNFKLNSNFTNKIKKIKLPLPLMAKKSEKVNYYLINNKSECIQKHGMRFTPQLKTIAKWIVNLMGRVIPQMMLAGNHQTREQLSCR